jgi:hypothetical protein
MGKTASLASLGSIADTSLGFRNRIINGDMRIDQRNAGASVTPADSAYTLDRYQVRLTQSSKYSVTKSSVAPAGFINSLLVTSLSAFSVGSTDFFQVRQLIEGYNVSDLGWGTSSAQPVTISFWARSSLTGTFGGVLSNANGDRSYQFSYSIAAANTWEQKTVTIAGDTTGTWPTGNVASFVLAFALGAGSSVSGSTGSWGSTLYRSVTGAVSVVGTSGATFYITGVQLEAGSVASPFERRDYGRELIMCSRYFQAFIASGSINYWGGTGRLRFQLPVQMRAAPTFALTGTGDASGLTTLSGGSFTESFTTAGRYDNTTSALANWQSASAYIPVSAAAEL